jgi:hypothetical protein
MRKLGDERKTFRSSPWVLGDERKTFPSSPRVPRAIPFVLVILELSQALKIGE